MRDLRSINNINEDNNSGFHSTTVYADVDRAVTGGNDAPPPVSNAQLVASVKKAKNILTGKHQSKGDTVNIDDHSITNINIDQSVHHSSLGDGLAWFGSHWKEIAIVAGAAALLLALAKLIKGLNRSIKVRYNRVVKTLQRAQRDFTLAEDGLNMKSVMPGIGSSIFDWIARTWTLNWKSKRHKRGNIGLHPFCSQYIEEIEMDFRTAQDAFSKIKLGADESSVDADRETDSSAGAQNVSTSMYSGKVYSSFHEAYAEDFLNEGVSPDKVDESVLAMISAGVALTSLAVRAGSFIYQRYKNGKPTGEPKQIQVTKESTREICYAIINNYADKYINMQQVFKELGITSQSLADIDTSACDKLKIILQKYQKPEKNNYTKQYKRIEEAYLKMLKHYYNIGDGIISNFVKYSEEKDEKHANLIVASKEKLKNMWESQQDFYNNNFSHVLIEIISSDAYIGYLDFIIEKVIPVFKSGLASDADYILDVVPRKGEYYILRQTGNGQAAVGDGEIIKGNVAIAEVVDFNRNEKKMKFKLVGLVKGNVGDVYTIDDDGVATLSTNDIDYDAYKDHNEYDEDYGKWLSLDPVLLDWTPELYTPVYKRNINVNGEKIDQYVYAYAGRDEEDKGFNKFICLNTKQNTFEILSMRILKINNYLSEDEVNKFLETNTEIADNNIPNFVSYDNGYWANKIRSYYRNYQGDGAKEEDVKNTDELAKKLGSIPEENNEGVKYSNVFTREFNNGEDTNDQYVYAYNDEDNANDKFKTIVVTTTKKGSNEILNIGVYNISNYLSNDDLNNVLTSGEFDPKFTDTATNFSKSDLKGYVESYREEPPEAQEIKTTDELAKIINKQPEKEAAVKYSNVYKRRNNGEDQYVYGYGDKDDKDEYNNIFVVKMKEGVNDIIGVNLYTLDTPQTPSDLKGLLTKLNFVDTDKNYNDHEIKNYLAKYKNKPEPVSVGTTDELVKALNHKEPTSKYSKIYKRTVEDTDQYTFAYGTDDDKYEFNIINIVSTKVGTREISSYDSYKINNFLSEDDFQKLMDSFNPKFVSTNVYFDKSELKAYIEKYTKTTGAEVKTKDVKDTDGFRSIVNSGDVALKKLKTEVKELFDDVTLDNGIFVINKNQSQNVKVEDINSSNNTNKTKRLKVTFNDPGVIFTLALSSKAPQKIQLKVNGETNGTLITTSNWNVDNLVSALSNVLKKTQQNSSLDDNGGESINDSVSVTYSFDTTTNESVYTSSVNVTRKFNKRMKNWFVLSEAIYDDGSNKVSRLDNPRFVNKLLERSDCAGFAKSSKLAKFIPYDVKQNYTLMSEKMYVPSVATPLYENVLLVKFDKMDRVVDKKYLGKHKIG